MQIRACMFTAMFGWKTNGDYTCSSFSFQEVAVIAKKTLRTIVSMGSTERECKSSLL